MAIIIHQVKAVVPFTTTSSSFCRLNCINKFDNFCANSDFTDGTCCDWTGVDCRNNGLCSNDIPDENRNTGMEYFTCPRENYCGEQFIIVRPFESEIAVDNYLFRGKNMCTYNLRFDIRAGPRDIMYVSVLDVDNTSVGYAIGTHYGDAKGGQLQ